MLETQNFVYSRGRHIITGLLISAFFFIQIIETPFPLYALAFDGLFHPRTEDNVISFDLIL